MTEHESVVRHAVKNAATATMAAAELLARHRHELDDDQIDDLLTRIHHRGAAIVRMMDELDDAETESVGTSGASAATADGAVDPGPVAAVS